MWNAGPYDVKKIENLRKRFVKINCDWWSFKGWSSDISALLFEKIKAM
jgi:hypothetical protein